MNKYWPNNWKKSLPNFLGEDFFASFENMDIEGSSTNTSINMNMYESGHELLCIFTLPGLKLEDVDIYVYEKTLEVSGTMHIDYNGFRLLHQEIYQGPVKRTVELPFAVRDDKVEAFFKGGNLFIHLFRLIRPEQSKNKVVVQNLDKTS
ncbi:Hsp20/alpha crystallin family protein [Halalkalibacter akibai]|uniref:Small heat shock protein n=1 Tax=Halalkalibacter akibai (strain ATCC 43226 / DSM 21942 / CIP 109018 / JCM 9157 / 1139) TaxID=1236973 RepID=W4QSK5_HALA3|nr:Hsp20/alpha crystallin family protein [Halalkalibacter akibai]GAE34314.1 small heat shock protein [Halalkalibacter akibai JCM 9157]